MATNLIPLNSPEFLVSSDAFKDQAPPRPQLHGPTEKEREDACSYLFALCKRLDVAYLQARGITCLFDVHGGSLSAVSCHTMGLMVAALVIDIAAGARGQPRKGVIAITLHCWGAVWACSVSDSGIQSLKSRPIRPPQIVRRLAKKMNAQLDHRATKDGATTAFMFEPTP